jgi:hypothetical protein
MNLPFNTDKLLAPQRPHAIKLLTSIFLNGIACDLSETGCGKTFVASWIAKHAGLPVVVIGPKCVLPSWERTLASFGVKASVLVNFEKLTRGGTPYMTFAEPTKKTNPKTGQPMETYRYQLVRCKFPTGALVIVDESHKCKGVTSLNGGILMDLKRQGYKMLLLSATQATNPTEMRAFGYAANLHDLYSWKKWCLENGAQEVGRWGAMTFDSENEESMKKMSGCHTNLFDIQGICSRLTRVEMGTLFPDNQIVADAYDLGENNPKIKAVYDEMEAEIAALEEGTEGYSQHIFAEIMKARRRAEMLKVPLFAEMVEDLYDERKSVVVFLNFTESIVALQDRLNKKRKFKNKIGLIHGEISFKQRWKDIDDFNADKKRILICNLKAGGASLSFHDLNGKFARAALISPSFSAVDLCQALGRIHRQGGKTPCYQRIVYAAGCIEEQACRKVQSRLNNLSCLNDGDLTEGFTIFNKSA